MSVNKTAKTSVKQTRQTTAHVIVRDEQAHTNWMGGPSYKVGDPIFNLRLAASSCFFNEPTYYHDSDDKGPRRKTDMQRRGESLSAKDRERLRKTLNAIDPQEWRDMTPQQMMESAIDKALDANVKDTLCEAARLRTDDHIRTTPQVIMVRAAHHANGRGTGLVNEFAKQVIQRPDELAVQLAYQIATYGRKAIPNGLKKAWKRVLESLSEDRLAKYRMDSRECKLVDVVNLCHPKSDACSKLVKGELRNTDKTWEAIVSDGGSDKATWMKALDVMPHMALLRNLRNLIQAGVEPKLFTDKLVEGAAKGKQLPFRYYSAYNAVRDCGKAGVLDAIEECLEQSLGNLPHFGGRVMSLADNSGSAWGATTSSMGTMHIAQIANLQGAITARVSDEGYCGVFGDRLNVTEVRKKSSVFELANRLDEVGHTVGGGTEHGVWLFWDKAIREKQHWDSVFAFSDQQMGWGGLYGTGGGYPVWPSIHGHQFIDVPQLVIEYRNKVNPDVKVFLVQIAGYQDTIIPEFYDKTAIIGGWGDGLLRFAKAMEGMWQ